MFITAAESVAETLANAHFEEGLIYHLINEIPDVSIHLSVKVAEEILTVIWPGLCDPKICSHL
jgi:hypothetical protein